MMHFFKEKQTHTVGGGGWGGERKRGLHVDSEEIIVTIVSIVSNNISRQASPLCYYIIINGERGSCLLRKAVLWMGKLYLLE